jgi:hypothetical protein
MILVATKMVKQIKNFPSPIFGAAFVLDPGWIKIRIRDKHTGSATNQIIVENGGPESAVNG